jgi:hypothetical protein
MWISVKLRRLERRTSSRLTTYPEEVRTETLHRNGFACRGSLAIRPEC